MSPFRPIGPQPEREAVRVAAIFARDAEGRVLAQLRDSREGVAAAGKWSLFGGRAEAGETLAEAAAREFEEEVGLRFAPDAFLPMAKLRSAVLDGWGIYVFELAKPVAPERIRLGEGAGFAFLTPEQLPQFDFIANYQQFFEQIFD